MNFRIREAISLEEYLSALLNLGLNLYLPLVGSSIPWRADHLEKRFRCLAL